MNKIIKTLALTTSLGIIIYWTLVFTHIFPVQEIYPGYSDWFMSFPAADLWIATTSMLVIYYQTKNFKLANIFLTAAGSGLIFLGIYAFAYGYRTGLLFQLTSDELIEIGIKIYCLSVGGYFIYMSYQGLSNEKQKPT